MPAQTQHITKARSPWIEEATRLHDADDHYCFRRHGSKNAAVHGSWKQHVSTMQTTTAVSADVPAQTQHITKARSLWVKEATRLHDADDHYCFRGHTSKNAESMEWGSDAVPLCNLVGSWLPFLAEIDDLADRCVVLAA